ncbi:hypothetical protein D3C85_1526470 [compost metagenome]
MSADWIEIPEQRDGPARIGTRQIAEYVLDNQLAPTIWAADATYLGILCHRQVSR